MKRQDKLPIRERAALTLRAWRTVRRFCPGLLGATAARAAAAALQPFASVLLSARIVDEIAGERDAGMLALWTALTVSVNFLFSVVKGCFDKLHSDRENQMWCTFGRLFSEKQLSMDYADVEDAAVQKQKDREKNNLFQFGNGLAQFVWTLRDMLQGAFSVAASAGAVAALFASRSSSAVRRMPHRYTNHAMPSPQVTVTRSTRSETLAKGVLGLYFCMHVPPLRPKCVPCGKVFPFFPVLTA